MSFLSKKTWHTSLLLSFSYALDDIRRILPPRRERVDCPCGQLYPDDCGGVHLYQQYHYLVCIWGVITIQGQGYGYRHTIAAEAGKDIWMGKKYRKKMNGGGTKRVTSNITKKGEAGWEKKKIMGDRFSNCIHGPNGHHGYANANTFHFFPTPSRNLI